MIGPRRRSPLKRGAGATCTEGRNRVKDGQRPLRAAFASRGLRSTAGVGHRGVNTGIGRRAVFSVSRCDSLAQRGALPAWANAGGEPDVVELYVPVQQFATQLLKHRGTACRVGYGQND